MSTAMPFSWVRAPDTALKKRIMVAEVTFQAICILPSIVSVVYPSLLGSHLHIAHRSICDQDQESSVKIVARILRRCGYIFECLCSIGYILVP